MTAASTSQTRPGWRQLPPSFWLMWSSRTVSDVGTQVSVVALPAIAVIVLHTSAVGVGALSAVRACCFVLAGPLSGVAIDRWPRRSVMVAADVLRLICIGSIPVAYLLHGLTLAQLFAVNFLVSGLNMIYGTAYLTHLPGVVGRDLIIPANSVSGMGTSASNMAGLPFGGWLISLFGAPLAVIADAVSFAVSAVLLWNVKTTQAVRAESRPILRHFKSGLEFMGKRPQLWRLAGATATTNLGADIALAVYFVMLYRVLRFDALTVGFMLAAGGLAAFVGAAAAPRLRRVGSDRAVLLVAIVAEAVGWFLLAAAHPSPAYATLAFAGIAVSNGGLAVYLVIQNSYLQRETPGRDLGLVNSTFRTIVLTVAPFGFVLGGVLGQIAGVPTTLTIAGVINLAALAWRPLPPTDRTRQAPVPATPEPPVTAHPR